MTAITQGAVDNNLAGRGPEVPENLAEEDGDVRPCGGPSVAADMVVDPGMGLGIELLVALMELPRVRAWVSRPPPMRMRWMI